MVQIVYIEEVMTEAKSIGTRGCTYMYDGQNVKVMQDDKVIYDNPCRLGDVLSYIELQHQCYALVMDIPNNNPTDIALCLCGIPQENRIIGDYEKYKNICNERFGKKAKDVREYGSVIHPHTWAFTKCYDTGDVVAFIGNSSVIVDFMYNFNRFLCISTNGNELISMIKTMKNDLKLTAEDITYILNAK